MAPAAATGTWKTKIARQSKASVSAPPATGPSAVAKTAAPSHRRRPGPAPPRGSENGATPPGAPGARAAADRRRAARAEQPGEFVGARARRAGHREEGEAAGPDRARREGRGGAL